MGGMSTLWRREPEESGNRTSSCLPPLPHPSNSSLTPLPGFYREGNQVILSWSHLHEATDPETLKLGSRPRLPDVLQAGGPFLLARPGEQRPGCCVGMAPRAWNPLALAGETAGPQTRKQEARGVGTGDVLVTPEPSKAEVARGVTEAEPGAGGGRTWARVGGCGQGPGEVRGRGRQSHRECAWGLCLGAHSPRGLGAGSGPAVKGAPVWKQFRVF